MVRVRVTPRTEQSGEEGSAEETPRRFGEKPVEEEEGDTAKL